MQLETIWQVIGWLSLPALLVLAPLLVQRGMHRHFPFFVYYIWTSAFVGLVRLCMSRSSVPTYFKLFWITDAVTTVFACLATYELLVKRLFPEFHRVRFYRYLFPALALVLTTLGVSIFLYHHKAIFLYRALHAVDLMRVITMLFFVSLMMLMGRLWSNYEFGIAFGMSVESALLLASMAIWTKGLTTISSITGQLPSIGYDLACMIWLIYFWRAEKSLVPVQEVRPEVIEQIREVEQGVKGWLANKKD
jgi:hypothetical protein